MSDNEVLEAAAATTEDVPAGRLGDFNAGTMEQRFVELYHRADDLGRLVTIYQITAVEKMKDSPEELEKVSQLNRLVLTFCANVQDFLAAMAQDPDGQDVSPAG